MYLKALHTLQITFPMGGIAVVFASNRNITNDSISEQELQL